MCIKQIKVAIWALLTIFTIAQSHAQCYDVLVALDGSGDYTSIQAAIEDAPSDLMSPYIIFIKDGVYDEKLYIQKNFITLVGESRDSTIITTAELRRVWRETHDDDWGAATINVANTATDLTLAHLTVRNNFADVFPNFPDNNDHTFAIRGGGHRVIIIDCNIVATGGDTLSLWNTSGGMFYHNNCYIEGYVDYLAPRGYCYVTDCTFFGHNSTASIWHDGTGGEDHKLVIRNSFFTGVTGFALGRYHKDAAFYLLSCEFSETMKNQEIYHTGTEPLAWGERVYYSDCHGPFVDWTWFKDNLTDDPDNPQAGDIGPDWTFKGEWFPEEEIDGLLPYAAIPEPAHNSACNDIEPALNWVPGMCADAHLVYFGEANPPEFAAKTTDPSYNPGTLQYATQYFWRVDEITETDTIQGELWYFHTSTEDARPLAAHSPDPPDQSDYTTNIIRLDWDYQVCDVDSFLVYYGTSPEDLEFETRLKYPPYFRPNDEDDSLYYWRVDAKNASGVTEGPVWSFRLNPTSTATLELENNLFELRPPVPNPSNGPVRLEFVMHRAGDVSVSIFGADGALVEQHEPVHFPAGENSITVLDSSDYSTGVYFCRIESMGRTETTRLIHHN